MMPAVHKDLFSHIAYTTTTLFFSDLGLLLNVKKSNTCPTPIILFMDSIVDMTAERAFLPEYRFKKKPVQYILNIQICQTHKVFFFLGLMVATTYVTPFVQLNMRPVEHCISQVYRPNLNSLPVLISMPPDMLDLLTCWSFRSVQFNPPSPSARVTLDV